MATDWDALCGQDILLDETMQPVVAANGELVLSTGRETVLQDIRLRFFIYLGELFYDAEFGSIIRDWVHDENTPLNRRSLCAEVVRRLHLDPRVAPGSGACSVAEWDENGITLNGSFRLIDETNTFNLVITMDDDITVIIDDIDPV